jgi:hypothetical protein
LAEKRGQELSEDFFFLKKSKIKCWRDPSGEGRHPTNPRHLTSAGETEGEYILL